MTSESDDLKLQRLIDVNFINFRKKVLTNSEKNPVDFNFKRYTKENSELEVIVDNLKKLYWELEIINDLHFHSDIGNRVVISINNNLTNLENSLLERISLINSENIKLNRITENKSEKLQLQKNFLEMVIGNLKELQQSEVGNEYIALAIDIQYLLQIIKNRGDS